MGDKKLLQVGDRTIKAESLDLMVFPERGITQGDLIAYYRRISETMLPHIQDRPLTMQRYPNGIDEEGFYQRAAPDYFPDWIERVRVEVEEEDEKQDQLVCNNEATLAFLVDQGCVTFHVWLSRTDRLRYPDKLVFDLDPPDDEFEPIRSAAKWLHDVLDEVGLTSFLMTTGSRGLHVVVPLDRSTDFDTVRAFAKGVAELLAQRHPEDLTVEMRKADRQGRLFLDYLRNAYGQNSVAPYAVRALPGAPIATPLDWDELGNPDLHAQSYTIGNIFRRLGQKEDPWKGMRQHAQFLDESRQRLNDPPLSE